MRALFLTLFLFTAPAFALTVEQPLADTVKEQQAQTVFAQLKCVVCEGQALAESDATLARQMRAEIREMVQEGWNQQTIVDTFTARYGKQVLLNPPLERATLLLWSAPLLLLAAGMALLRRVIRRP